MDEDEAGTIAAGVLDSLRDKAYQELVSEYRGSHEHLRIVGESGTPYEVEIEVFWDSGKPGNVRVMVAVDDGGWRATLLPLIAEFIMAPDGSLIGE